MKMKKIIEALPLLGSFSLLIIVALFFLSFAKAEAALQIDTSVVPPAALEKNSDQITTTTPTLEVSEVVAPVVTTSQQPSQLQSNWLIILAAIVSVALVIILTIISVKNSLWKK